MRALRSLTLLLMLPLAVLGVFAVLWLDDLHELGDDRAQRCRDCGGA